MSLVVLPFYTVYSNLVIFNQLQLKVPSAWLGFVVVVVVVVEIKLEPIFIPTQHELGARKRNTT